MKKNIIVILIVILVITGLAWWGKSAQKSAPIATSAAEGEVLAGDLFAEETFYDFKTIRMKDGKVSYSFNVINKGESDLVLERVTTSCMCTVAYVVNGENKKGPFGMPGHGGSVPKVNDTIKAGEAREIEVVFDPNAHGPAGVGLIERVVQLEYAGQTLELNIKAVVTP